MPTSFAAFLVFLALGLVAAKAEEDAREYGTDVVRCCLPPSRQIATGWLIIISHTLQIVCDSHTRCTIVE